jgi:hypothetical protein
MNYDELIDKARELGISVVLELAKNNWPPTLLTKDAIRLKIIDKICDRELLDREGPTVELEPPPPPPRDPGIPSR